MNAHFFKSGARNLTSGPAIVCSYCSFVMWRIKKRALPEFPLFSFELTHIVLSRHTTSSELSTNQNQGKALNQLKGGQKIRQNGHIANYLVYLFAPLPHLLG